MIGPRVQWVLNTAVNEAQQRRHAYLTLEHILFGIARDSMGQRIIDGCGGSALVLCAQLELFFDHHLETLEIEIEPSELVQTLSVQRVFENSLQHMRSSGRMQIDVGDLLAAMLEEEGSYAAYYLAQQNINRLDVLEFISHEMEQEESAGEGGAQDLRDPLLLYTVNLTDKALEGEIDPLIGRDAELLRCIEVLARRRKNNPLLIGEPGVGKTAIAEGLALRIVEGAVPPIFQDTEVFALDMGSLLAGARYRGDFEARIKGVLKSLHKRDKSILFIDEIHTLVGAGSTSGSSMDASNILKPVLADGSLRCIGSTTYEEFRNSLEKDKALTRRFQRVEIREPSQEECVNILKGLRKHYEAHHHVRFPLPALKAAVELSARHIQDRFLPDKAIDVMDEAGAMVHLRTGVPPATHVTVQDIESVVARMAQIPEKSVLGEERTKLRGLEKAIRSVIFGQDEAVDMTVRSILRKRAGLRHEQRPAGSFLFYGPTGVGKTELAKQIAAHLGIAFLRFDMSEYMEKHAVARLVGAPPGYVGFDQGGLLTEAVRKKPYAVVLLDEMEKAHPDIFSILLQVMDYGTLTDTTGRKADFSNVILIMTSNAGVREMASPALGFGNSDLGTDRRGLKAVEGIFSPEFRNRLDAMVPFHALSREHMGCIVDKMVGELRQNLEEKKIELVLSAAARERLAEKGYDPAFGARPLQRVLRVSLEDELAQEILFGALRKGGKVEVRTTEEAPEHATASSAKRVQNHVDEKLGLVYLYTARASSRSTRKMVDAI